MYEDLEEKLKKYQLFLASSDIVDLGLYRNIDAAYLARCQKTGPPFVQMNRKVLYPKELLLQYLRDNTIVFDSEKTKEVMDIKE